MASEYMQIAGAPPQIFLNGHAICAAKSRNSVAHMQHLENQLDLFLPFQSQRQATQGFLAHNVLLLPYYLFIFLTETCLTYFLPGDWGEISKNLSQ